MALVEVTGTDLDQIRDDADSFGELVAQQLRGAVNEATKILKSTGSATVVSQGAPVAATPDDINALPLIWQARVSDNILPWIQRAVEAGVASQLVSLNSALGRDVITSFDEQVVARVILEGAQNRLTAIGNEVWEQARIAISEGVAAGQSIPDIARSIREVADVTTPQAIAIARTEVIGASNKSSIEVMRATGLVALKRWIATFDRRVRATHIEAHGQVVPINAAFDVGGAALDCPGDFMGPAEEVVNCRCAMGYVLQDDLTEQEQSELLDETAGGWVRSWH